MLANLIWADCILSSRSSMKLGNASHISPPSFLVSPWWVISLYALIVTDSFSLNFHLTDISPVHVFFCINSTNSWQLQLLSLPLLRGYKSRGNCRRCHCCLTPALRRSNTGANGAQLFTLGKDLTAGAEHSVVASTNSPRWGFGSGWGGAK